VVVTFYWKVQLFEKCVLLLMLGILGARFGKNFIKQIFKIQIFPIKI
jgi:hypothetical protein